MADEADNPEGLEVAPAFYRVDVCEQYIGARTRGAFMTLDELYAQIDRAASAAERCLEERERPVRAAALAGYRHALVRRTQGKASAPETFVV